MTYISAETYYTFTHLLFHLLLDLLQVGPQIYGYLVFGAQQGTKHGISRHVHFLQDWFLELALEVLHLHLRVFSLQRLQVTNTLSLLIQNFVQMLLT